MARLAISVGAVRYDPKKKRNVPQVSAEEIEAYWEILNDIPADILQRAFVIVVGQHQYRGLPSPGRIRSAAIDATIGIEMTAGEAWEKCRHILRRISIYDADRSKQLIRDASPNVRQIGDRLGWYTLKDMPSEEARRTFCIEWDRSVDKRRKKLAIPGEWPSALALPYTDRTKLLTRSGDGV